MPKGGIKKRTTTVVISEDGSITVTKTEELTEDE